jgi:hypothetical protein
MFLNVQLRKVATFYAFMLFSNFDLVHGQTPPNYAPSTLNMLNLSFNEGTPIYPGQSLQPAGMMAFLWARRYPPISTREAY